MTVVIVEDDAGMRDSMQLLLEVHGHGARAYPSAEALLGEPEALEACALLILDHHLGGMTGIDLYRRLAELGPRPPAVLISARMNGAMARAAREAGFRDALEKPAPLDALLGAMDPPSA